MNKKALLIGIAYSFLIILFKLFILLGGYSLNAFAFFGLNICCSILIIPFYYFALKNIRDKDSFGKINGIAALKICLTIFAVGALLISIYNYYEFENYGKDLATKYYNSERFLTFLKSKNTIKSANYQSIILEQIKASETSSFKATTGKLFSFIIIAVSSSFLLSAVMKKE